MSKMGLGLGLGAGCGKAWTPVDYGGKLLWLRGDLGTSTTTDGAACTSWTDQVASRVASQATGSKKPAFTASAINGKPGLAFTAGALSELDFGLTWAAIFGSQSNWCVWLVGVLDSVSSNGVENVNGYANVGLFTDGGNYSGIHARSGGPKLLSYFYGANEATAAAAFVLGTPFLVRARRVFGAPGTTYARVNNGAEASTAGQAGNGGTGNVQIGGVNGSSITGRICEIMVSLSPSAADLAGADAYFKSRYGLWV